MANSRPHSVTLSRFKLPRSGSLVTVCDLTAGKKVWGSRKASWSYWENAHIHVFNYTWSVLPTSRLCAGHESQKACLIGLQSQHNLGRLTHSHLHTQLVCHLQFWAANKFHLPPSLTPPFCLLAFAPAFTPNSPCMPRAQPQVPPLSIALLYHLQAAFFFSFPDCMPFISFSYLIALARTSNTMLKRVVRGEILTLYLILGAKLWVSHHGVCC